jgi:hypothetical protein
MAEPTIETRLLKRIIAMTTDQAIVEAMNALLQSPWELIVATDLDELGEWNDVLLYKFILLDLDEFDAFDPIDVIRQIRMEYQINIPVFCFGGDEDIQEEMRLSRADRFFSRDEMLKMLPVFVEQYK